MLQMSRLAIIPARSGSKGIIDKNIKLMNGIPLIAYSIQAAIESQCFDEIMVSTDSEKYAEIAKKYHASVPFLRSSETSGDSASSWDMVKEVLSEYAKVGVEFDEFCLLQPTSPLRDAHDIEAAFKLFEEKNANSVISVCKAEHSPLWCGKLDETMSLNNFIPKENMKNRQAGGTFYRLNGAIYIFDIKAFYLDSYIFKDGSYAYLMEDEKSIDIDTEMDFRIAEFLLKER